MILMYHNVLPKEAPKGYLYQSISLGVSDFQKQVKWLRKFFKIVSLDEYLSNKSRSINTIAITFDDGTAATYDTIKPIVEESKTPVTIFVATIQMDKGPLIWAAYINALCFEGCYDEIFIDGKRIDFKSEEISLEQIKNHIVNSAIQSGNPKNYVDSLSSQYPIPEPIKEFYCGMTTTQILDASKGNYITLEPHSVSHPFLSGLSKSEQEFEIGESKRVIESIQKKGVTAFAYPSGDYDRNTIEILKDYGFKYGVAVQSRNLGFPEYEINRIGVFSPSILKLFLKMVLGMFKNNNNV